MSGRHAGDEMLPSAEHYADAVSDLCWSWLNAVTK
jgi:hypothetical protein